MTEERAVVRVSQGAGDLQDEGIVWMRGCWEIGQMAQWQVERVITDRTVCSLVGP